MPQLSISARVRLGRSELRVSPICFGTWQLGGEWGDFDEGRAMATISHARSLGINFFDTAQAYGFGQSEELLGRALHYELTCAREEVVIATKGGLRAYGDGVVRDSSPAWLREGVEKSLEALGTEWIDLYQVHWPDLGTSFAETAETLAELVEAGKIRHVGVSNFSAEQLAEFSKTLPVETVQPPYHLFNRKIEEDVLPWCEANDAGVLAYGPLAHGLLTGTIDEQAEFPEGDWRRASPLFRGETLRRNLDVVSRLSSVAEEAGCTLSQLAVAWVLANPAVDVAIVGSRNPEHIEETIVASELKLGDHELARIDEIMERAVFAEGPSPEMER